VYPIKNKKLYRQRVTSPGKGDAACHISENAQSVGPGVVFGESSFFKVGI